MSATYQKPRPGLRSNPGTYRPASQRASSNFFWVYIVAFSWAAIGICALVYGLISFLNLDGKPRLEAESLLLPYVAVFLSSLLFIGSFAVIFRFRWAYYYGLVLSIILLPLFPIGTVLGVVGIRSLVCSKRDFGI